VHQLLINQSINRSINHLFYPSQIIWFD